MSGPIVCSDCNGRRVVALPNGRSRWAAACPEDCYDDVPCGRCNGSGIEPCSFCDHGAVCRIDAVPLCAACATERLSEEAA